ARPMPSSHVTGGRRRHCGRRGLGERPWAPFVRRLPRLHWSAHRSGHVAIAERAVVLVRGFFGVSATLPRRYTGRGNPLWLRSEPPSSSAAATRLPPCLRDRPD